MTMSALPPEDTLAPLLESAPLGLLVYAADGTLAWANATLAEMLATPLEQWCGKPREAMPNAWMDGLYERPEFVHVPAGEGREVRWLHARYRELDDGRWLGFFMDFTEIKALVEERDHYRQKFEAINTIDAVTGLLNHRGVFQALEPQVSRSRRYGNTLSVAILRLGEADEFERRFAPPVRKPVLVAFTQLLNDQTRWADFLGRLEGAEFMFVLPETGEGDALALVSKIRECLDSLALPEAAGAEALPAMCVGVAEWKKGDDPGTLMRRARENLECQV